MLKDEAAKLAKERREMRLEMARLRKEMDEKRKCKERKCWLSVVVRPKKSSEVKVSEVSPYRNMRSKKGNEGQGRGATTETIRHLSNKYDENREC